MHRRSRGLACVISKKGREISKAWFQGRVVKYREITTSSDGHVRNATMKASYTALLNYTNLRRGEERRGEEQPT
jgi:hypothetical protein